MAKDNEKKDDKQKENEKYINVTNDHKKGHVNIYDKNPRGEHDSIHININYEKETFNIVQKENGEKEVTDAKCILTTACMKNLGQNFDDNCQELITLRNFRDKFVSKEEISYYYEIAPIIIENIEKINQKNKIYEYIYKDVVKACVDAINRNDYSFAYNRYKNSVLVLEQNFVKPILQQRLIKTLKKC